MKKAKTFLAILSLAFAMMIAFSTEVAAECNQSDLSGTWYVYGAEDRCKLVIESNGAINTDKSLCKDYERGATGRILSGQVSINQSCRVSGEIDVEDDGLHAIKHAWMNKNKDMFIGTGFERGFLGTFYADFSAVKQ
jgi:hypothetical protein